MLPCSIIRKKQPRNINVIKFNRYLKGMQRIRDCLLIFTPQKRMRDRSWDADVRKAQNNYKIFTEWYCFMYAKQPFLCCHG